MAVFELFKPQTLFDMGSIEIHGMQMLSDTNVSKAACSLYLYCCITIINVGMVGGGVSVAVTFIEGATRKTTLYRFLQL